MEGFRCPTSGSTHLAAARTLQHVDSPCPGGAEPSVTARATSNLHASNHPSDNNNRRSSKGAPS